MIDKNLQKNEYDLKGQLLSVTDVKTGKKVEEYAYDPAGNILSKSIDGVRTDFTYDRANRLVFSKTGEKMIKFEYDAANRLVKVRNEVYSSIGPDKIANVTEDGKVFVEFNDHTDGQLADAKRGGKSESFLWDGFRLDARGHVLWERTARERSPVPGKGKPMFNDMPGRKNGTKYTSSDLTFFGDADSPKDCFDVRATSSAHEKTNVFFTGKSCIGELDYAFLYRSYRPENGKRQTVFHLITT